MRALCLVPAVLALVACNKKAHAPAATGPQTVTVTLAGGTYDIVSQPPGVQCAAGGCSGTFDAGARITLQGAQEFPQVDFDGPCEQRYVHTCTFVVTGPITVTATFHAAPGN